jgi:hypothetical protein
VRRGWGVLRDELMDRPGCPAGGRSWAFWTIGRGMDTEPAYAAGVVLLAERGELSAGEVTEIERLGVRAASGSRRAATCTRTSCAPTGSWPSGCGRRSRSPRFRRCPAVAWTGPACSHDVDPPRQARGGASSATIPSVKRRFDVRRSAGRRSARRLGCVRPLWPRPRRGHVCRAQRGSGARSQVRGLSPGTDLGRLRSKLVRGGAGVAPRRRHPDRVPLRGSASA